MRLALTLIALLCMLGPNSLALPPQKISVSSLNGSRVTPLDSGRRRATVLIFITNDCPIANGYAPEIERIFRAYAAKRIGFYLVYVDAAIAPADARKHHTEYGYTMPAVLDPRHHLVMAARVQVTPEAAVFNREGKLLYHGRIDDRAVAFGQVRVQPTRQDLRDTLNALLTGKPIPTAHKPAVGCSIADLGHLP